MSTRQLRGKFARMVQRVVGNARREFTTGKLSQLCNGIAGPVLVRSPNMKTILGWGIARLGTVISYCGDS